MAEKKNEKQLHEEKTVELKDLTQEMSEEQLKDVQGGDLKTGTKPIIKKVTIRP
ncbi:hypothetical protein [Paenibacillus mesophilus]|uniref:hypothetical protein n=1 Tax=Paenibacillus mesophilus TaxID=2582849 RepID=UPI0013053C31|nr:hypothetical protein [Paenibacillus mesophilus]